MTIQSFRDELLKLGKDRYAITIWEDKVPKLSDQLTRVLALIEAVRQCRMDARNSNEGILIEPAVWDVLVRALSDMRVAGDIEVSLSESLHNAITSVIRRDLPGVDVVPYQTGDIEGKQ